jgi:hypothetical protein
MDLLFKRYASPFLFMDGMIQTGRFFEFVIDFTKTINREMEEKYDWEYFLHKVFDMTYQEFKEEIKINTQNQQMSERDIETAIGHSMNILKNFNPEEGGE